MNVLQNDMPPTRLESTTQMSVPKPEHFSVISPRLVSDTRVLGRRLGVARRNVRMRRRGFGAAQEEFPNMYHDHLFIKLRH